MRRFTSSAVSLVVVLLLAGVAMGAGKITVVVDGKTIDGDYRLEDGRVVGPIAPIIEALGGNADFHKTPGELSIGGLSPWPVFDSDAGFFNSTGLFDFLYAGPVLAVRQHLCEVQAKSMADAASGQPVLVRFEIAGAHSLDLAAGGFPVNAQNPKPMTDGVRAVLYWADMKTGFSDNPLTQRQVEVEYPTGARGWYFNGPTVESGRVETVDYYVVSKDAQITDNLQGADVPSNAKAIGILYGGQGWQITDSRVIETKPVTLIEGVNRSVPLFDPAVQRVNPAALASFGVELK